jgi:outer membrane protein assembly factor BamB
LFAVGSSPLVVSDQVFFNVGAKQSGAGIIAMDRTTGATFWQATDHGAGYCMPYHAEIHSQKFLFVVTALGLVCLDPATGKVDWEYEHYSRSPMSFNSVSPLVHEDKVLIVTGPGPGAVCLQVQPDRSYREVWQDRRVLDSQYNTLMLADGLVYGFTAAGQGGAELRCIDFASGKLQWRYASVLRRGQAMVIGDAIVAVGERGHLAAISRTDFSPENEPAVLAFTEQPLMSEPSYCSPAFDGRYLYLKDELRLASFDLTNDRPADGH